MDRSYNQLLENLRDFCMAGRMLGRSRELLAIAAGQEDSIKEALECLSFSNLVSQEIKTSPLLMGEFVIALSVSRPQEIEELFYQWIQCPLQGDIKFDNPYIYWAILEGASFFRTREETKKHNLIKGTSPWSWNERINMTIFEAEKSNQLLYQPMKEKKLELDDFLNIQKYREYLIPALRFQDTKIHQDVFDYYAKRILETDSYVTGILIGLSRKTNFDQSVWLKELLKFTPRKDFAKRLDYIVYSLLGDHWNPPVGLSIKDVVKQYYC